MDSIAKVCLIDKVENYIVVSVVLLDFWTPRNTKKYSDYRFNDSLVRIIAFSLSRCGSFFISFISSTKISMVS